jgi:hypothetical protein
MTFRVTPPTGNSPGLSLDAPGYWGNDLTRLARVTGLEDRARRDRADAAHAEDT